MAIDGSIALVASPNDDDDDDDDGTNAGAIYEFDLTTGAFRRKVFATDKGRVDIYGSAMAVTWAPTMR